MLIKEALAEQELIGWDHFLKGRISKKWIRLKARMIFEEKKRANPGLWTSIELKGSYGWMRSFIKRKNIKSRRCKGGKEKTAEECIPEFEQFMSTLWLDFLPPREDGGQQKEISCRVGFHLSCSITWIRCHCLLFACRMIPTLWRRIQM